MIIFLDLDGVVNHTGMSMYDPTMKKVGCYYSDPRCDEKLKELILKLDATIVITSTWRILNDRQFFVDYFGEWFGDRMHEDWCTRKLGTIRGLEVRDWLERNVKDPYKFKDYIILDDDQDFLWHQPLVWVNHKTGLDDKHVEKALMIAHSIKKVEVPEVLNHQMLELLATELERSKELRRGTKATVAAMHQRLVDFYH